MFRVTLFTVLHLPQEFKLEFYETIIYGFLKWLLTLIEEHKLGAFGIWSEIY